MTSALDVLERVEIAALGFTANTAAPRAVQRRLWRLPDVLAHHLCMMPPPGSQEPGWYQDPWNSDYRRWFDGRQWTPNIDRISRHRMIFGPLLILAGVVVALFFLLSHPSVSVPLAGNQDCGAASWRLGSSNLSDYQNSGSSAEDLALEQECLSKGRTRIYYAVAAFAAGLVSGVMVSVYERSR